MSLYMCFIETLVIAHTVSDIYGQGILFSISAIWLINSTPRAIDYFNSWWCVIEQLHATRHPLDYILVMRAGPHLFQRSTLRKLPNSSYRDQILMHRRSIDHKSNQIKCFYWHTWFTSFYIKYIYYNNNILIQKKWNDGVLGLFCTHCLG